VVIVQDVTTSFQDELADAKTGDQALLDAIKANGGQSDLGVVAHTGWGTTLSPLRNVNTSYSTLTSVISSINHCGSPGMPPCSGTDIAAGLDQAVNVFDDPGYVANSSSKAIVLVSDGEPTSDPGGSHPGRTADQMLTLAQQSADAAWAKQIHVYVVFFNRTNSAAAADKLRTLPRGKGDFVQVTNASDLPAALESVTKKLPMQLVK
jgi:hypothetical protein